MGAQPSSSYTPTITVPSSLGLRMFSLAEIKKATNNFDQSLLLNTGWMSAVYKGTYDDNDGKLRTVAIKVFRLEYLSYWKAEFDEVWKPIFARRLEMWSNFRHHNVASVIGYCHEDAFPCHGRNALACIDAAHGLEYIHNNIKLSNGSLCTHGDVAATNILLDDNGVAKISDLYEDPLIGVLNKESSLYFDPQTHSMNRIYDLSSDVYGFGVLLIKVLSRKVLFDKEDQNLGIWFKDCIRDGTINDQIIHPEMKEDISPDTLTALISIAGECLNSEQTERPSINQVVKKLEFLLVSSSQRPCYQYSLNEIEDITNNFESILGRGGEGTVYKGATNTNTFIAVKCLKTEFSSEFEKEIKMLSNLDHPNLVSLIGYCHESDHKFLIYEFMSNGNLAQILYSTANPLSWTQCLNICIGAARGLRYLHTRTNISQKGIIHWDVKPVNILLDDNFNAKISDFGMSKMGPQNQANSEITTMIKGTPGYYAPEYLRYRKITRKVDVYAFGLVLSEVLCRKKPWDRDDESFYLTGNENYAHWAKEDINPYLKGFIAPYCLDLFVGILEKCLNTDPDKRPSMNEVVPMLEYALKWHETWQRQECGGEFCLPGGEDRPILYCKLNSIRSIQSRIILRSYSKIVEERDLVNDLCVMELKHALGNISTDIDIDEPQLFLQGKHAGDSNEIWKLHVEVKFAQDFGLWSPFICDTCQNAMACDNCSQIYWYLHCKNCGVLNVIWRKQGSKLRICLECNAGQLTFSFLTVYKKNIQR